jgi:hypothetical protein
MTLEWLRRKDATLDKHLRTYLFTEGSIVGLEDEAMGRDGGGGDGTGAGTTGLGIGSLKSAPTLLGGTP